MAEVIISAKIQRAVQPKSRRGSIKKNPLKNTAVMIKLNPYAKTAKRAAILAQEKHSISKESKRNCGMSKQDKRIIKGNLEEQREKHEKIKMEKRETGKKRQKPAKTLEDVPKKPKRPVETDVTPDEPEDATNQPEIVQKVPEVIPEKQHVIPEQIVDASVENDNDEVSGAEFVAGFSNDGDKRISEIEDREYIENIVEPEYGSPGNSAKLACSLVMEADDNTFIYFDEGNVEEPVTNVPKEEDKHISDIENKTYIENDVEHEYGQSENSDQLACPIVYSDESIEDEPVPEISNGVDKHISEIEDKIYIENDAESEYGHPEIPVKLACPIVMEVDGNIVGCSDEGIGDEPVNEIPNEGDKHISEIEDKIYNENDVEHKYGNPENLGRLADSLVTDTGGDIVICSVDSEMPNTVGYTEITIEKTAVTNEESNVIYDKCETALELPRITSKESEIILEVSEIVQIETEITITETEITHTEPGITITEPETMQREPETTEVAPTKPKPTHVEPIAYHVDHRGIIPGELGVEVVVSKQLDVDSSVECANDIFMECENDNKLCDAIYILDEPTVSEKSESSGVNLEKPKSSQEISINVEVETVEQSIYITPE